MIRSNIVAKEILKKRRKISINNIKFARPGTGISTDILQRSQKLRAKKKQPLKQLLTGKQAQDNFMKSCPICKKIISGLSILKISNHTQYSNKITDKKLFKKIKKFMMI